MKQSNEQNIYILVGYYHSLLINNRPFAGGNRIEGIFTSKRNATAKTRILSKKCMGHTNFYLEEWTLNGDYITLWIKDTSTNKWVEEKAL